MEATEWTQDINVSYGPTWSACLKVAAPVQANREVLMAIEQSLYVAWHVEHCRLEVRASDITSGAALLLKESTEVWEVLRKQMIECPFMREHPELTDLIPPTGYGPTQQQLMAAWFKGLDLIEERWQI